MTSCSITNNIYNTLLNEGIIDSKHNIIGPVGKSYMMIQQINDQINKEYGYLNQDGKVSPPEYITTTQVRGYLGKGTLVKINFNPEYEAYVEAVRESRESKQSSEYLYHDPEITMQDAQDQEIWDNISSKYNDRLVDESDFNEDWKNNEVSDDYESFNSPTPPPNLDPIMEYPASFGEWVDSRKRALDNLKRLHDQYFKLDRRDPVLKEINSAIEEIESQLDIADTDNPYNIYSSAVEEAEILDILIDKAQQNPDDALSIMENNDLERRVEDLNFYFLGRDKRIGGTSYGDNNLSKSEFYRDYMEHFGQYSKADMDKLQESIRKIKDKYDDAKKNLVISAFKNNSYVKQHINTGKLTADQITSVIQKIESGEFEVNGWGSRVLGLASNGGILGQLLYTKKEEATFKENAYVGKKISALNTVWEKIKDKKDSDGNYLTNSLFQIDQFGIRINRLISKYNDSFYSITKEIYREKNVFTLDKGAANYATWMKAEKDNFHRIDARKLMSVFNKYSQDSRFSKYFSGIDNQVSQDYENQLRQVLGPIMFEIEKQKAEEMIEDYVFNVETFALTPRQKVVKNPFAFLEHFNSDAFDKMSSSEGAFLEPSYTRFIPKLDATEYYNNQFNKIENNADLAEYYVGAHDIMTNYANPTFQGEGISVGGLDLQSFEDMLDRNAYKDLTLFGKIGANLKALRRDRVQRYSDGFLANMDERLEDESHNRQKLVVAYSGEIRNRIAKLKEVYGKLTFEQLREKAQQKGITGVRRQDADRYIKTTKSGKELKMPLFYELAESVARAELSSVTSTNIQESLHNSAYLAADIRARRSVVGMLEAFKDISQSVTIKKGNAVETKLGDTNIHKMLRMWGQANIYGEKFAGDMEDKGNGILSRVARQNFFNMTTLTGADKLTLKEIEETLNLNSDAVADAFVLNKDTYKVIRAKDDVHFYRNTTEISLEEYKNSYMKMLKSKIGTKITIGSLMLGYMDNLRAIQLGLSPRAGIKNRAAGMSQTMSVAASKRFDFNLNQYHAARRFLRGVNTRQYISKLGWTRNERNPKYVQVRMLEELVSNLELQQNRADELALEAQFNSNTTTNRIENIKNFFMDFSMNNPERHNQLEIAVAVMMNTKVKDAQGNEHQLFDEKGSRFNIYKPGTLELKDEFRTPENEVMWEKFQTYKDEASGQQTSDSIAMTTKIRGAIEQTQGNYNNNDIIMLQNSVAGKIATMYTRYFYENTNLQFGQHFIDLRTGEMNIKGRKINMLEHAPTTMTYLMSSWALPIIAGATVFTALNPWIAGVLGISGAIGLGYAIKAKQFKLDSFASWKEYKLAKDFALETLLLMGKTPLNVFSYGSVNPKVFDNQLDKLRGRHYDGLLTDRERNLLSECAQEVATKFNNYTAYTLMALLAKFVFTAIAGSGDDKDETYFQKKMKELVNIENIVNGLLNDRNQTMSDINRYVNPNQFYDDATAFSFFRSMAREGKTISKIVNGEYEDKDTSEMLNDVSKISFIPGLNMIPNNAKKAVIGLTNKDVGVFSDNRVYQGKDAIDKLMAKEMKKGEDYYKSDTNDKRKSLKKDAEEFFKRQVDKESEGVGMTSNEKEDEIKSRVRDFLGDTYKTKKGTYEDLIKSNVFEDKRKQLDDMKATQ